MKTFQQPLLKEEEDRYLYLLKHGTPAQSREAKEILITRNLRLVAHIAKKYQNTDFEMQDLLSIGTIGLIKAILSYDSDKSSKLATYAAKCIDNELLMMLRNKKKTSREVSIYEPIGTDKEGNEINLLDIISTDDECMLNQIIVSENLEKIYSLFSSVLDEKEQKVIALRYGLSKYEPLTQRQVASLLSISRSYVSRIEKKALLKLRSALIL